MNTTVANKAVTLSAILPGRRDEANAEFGQRLNASAGRVLSDLTQSQGQAIAQRSDEIQAQIAALKAENEALKAAAKANAKASSYMKVSEKGALSLYGLGKFPVTLYADTWIKVLDMSDRIRAFIDANGDSLKRK